MSDDVEKLVDVVWQGFAFQRGDVVVLESKVPISQHAAEILSIHFDQIYNVTGVRFVLLPYDLKVSEVHRNDPDK